MRILATPLTSGQATGYVEKSYRWNKIPDWTAGDPRYRTDGPYRDRADLEARHSTAARDERLREFTEHRADGLSVAEAGREVNVVIKTARAYERLRLAALKETS